MEFALAVRAVNKSDLDGHDGRKWSDQGCRCDRRHERQDVRICKQAGKIRLTKVSREANLQSAGGVDDSADNGDCFSRRCDAGTSRISKTPANLSILQVIQLS
jgi:hypothetical protein